MTRTIINTNFKTYFVVLGWALLSVIFATSAQAQSSTIQTTLCSGSQAPQVTVSQPVSDSVVTKSPAKLVGNAQNTTQIDIFINDNYTSSVTPGQGGSFNTSVALGKGDNTVRLDAYFSCNQQTDSISLVVTYRPVAQPPQGGSVNTNVDGGPGLGIIIGPDTNAEPAEEAQDPLERLRQKLLIPPIAEYSQLTLERIAVAIVSWIGIAMSAVSVLLIISPRLLLGLLEIEEETSIGGVSLQLIVRAIGFVLVPIMMLLLLL